MKKGLTTITLAALMLLTITVHAVGDAAVTPELKSGNDGLSHEIEFSIVGNPGIASWMIELTWDPSEVQYDSISYGQAFSKGTYIKNSNTPGKLNVMWYSATNVSVDGVLFSVKLKSDEKREDSCTINLSVSPEDTVNEKGEMVTLKIDSSVILPALVKTKPEQINQTVEINRTENEAAVVKGDSSKQTVEINKIENEDSVVERDSGDQTDKAGSVSSVASPNTGVVDNSMLNEDAASSDSIKKKDSEAAPTQTGIGAASGSGGQSTKKSEDSKQTRGSDTTSSSGQDQSSNAPSKIIQTVPTQERQVSFTDVNKSDYYYDAVNWAVREKVTGGVSDKEFAPNGACTRAQAVTFLWRAAGSPEPSIIADLFSDVSRDQYYYQAVMWAVEKEITLGTGEATFSPNATVTRGQLVTFLWRSAGREQMSGINSFQDVHASDYFSDSVNWAVSRGITLGTGQNVFSPNATCTRGQTVTFLYRFAQTGRT